MAIFGSMSDKVYIRRQGDQAEGGYVTHQASKQSRKQHFPNIPDIFQCHEKDGALLSQEWPQLSKSTWLRES